jgi:hypothetical protein
MWEGRIVEPVAQGPDLLGHGPENELIEGHALLGCPGFGIVLELHGEIQGIARHDAVLSAAGNLYTAIIDDIVDDII